MTRQEKEKFCKESAEDFNTHTEIDWSLQSDEVLDKYVDWFDYLWEK